MEVKYSPTPFVPWYQNPRNTTIPKDLTAENAVKFFKGLRIYNMVHRNRGKLKQTFYFDINGKHIEVKYRCLGGLIHYFCLYGPSVSSTGYKSVVIQETEFNYGWICDSAYIIATQNHNNFTPKLIQLSIF